MKTGHGADETPYAGNSSAVCGIESRTGRMKRRERVHDRHLGLSPYNGRPTHVIQRAAKDLQHLNHSRNTENPSLRASSQNCAQAKRLEGGAPPANEP